MKKQKILFTSTNKSKIKEVKEILKDYEILSLNDIGYRENIIENGKTYLENSLIKLNKLKEFFPNMIILSDDSGFEIEELPNIMGVKTHRYMGVNTSIDKKIHKLLKIMKNKKNRNIKLRCCLTLYIPKNNLIYIIEETTLGKLSFYLKGNKGFGYDKIFFDKKLNKTFAEMTIKQKNKISARGLAGKKVLEILKINERSEK